MLRPNDRLQETFETAFKSYVQHTRFPCVGAKAALARDQIKVVACHSVTSAWDDLRLQDELMKWAHAYKRRPKMFCSFAAVFERPRRLTEAEFERALWDRVQSIADKDAWRGQPYDRRVSSDPEDPRFSLSFGGEAFFVVGLHPRASRPARRFAYPALVFNLHDQFTTLRAGGRYETMRKKILQRDEMLAGSVNPMLARHGEVSEARQYSGRHVGADWRCPFHDPRMESA